jgi:HAD superfamily hydrolase (TIGR01509 family)
VIVDSEVLSNHLIAEAITRLGHPMTTQEAVDRYIGRHWGDTLAAIERDIGRPLPPNFKRKVDEAFRLRVEEAGPVAGVEAFLDSVAGVPKAVASSSATAWLRSALGRLGLAHHFGDRLYSTAEHVSRGKPAPDIYLHAAEALAVEPGETLVIEDTAPGVTAACAAGMTVVGLCAGRHCGAGYGGRLRSAGASHVVRAYSEVFDIIGFDR